VKQHSEKRETPAMEAKMHPKRFLIAALRKEDPKVMIHSSKKGHESNCGCSKCK
jgi:hypothetical protein